MAISRSVGPTGQNLTEDVETVQRVLSAWLTRNAFPTIDVTGVVDADTVAAIGAFEAAQGMAPTGLLHVVVEEEQVLLAQGQGDGDTLAEACNAAREACKEGAGCPPGTPLKIGKCTCWRGGTQAWTCVVQCGCATPVA